MKCDLNYLAIDGKNYCPDNGYFCPYYDKVSETCIATNCRHAQDLLMQVEVEKQARAQRECEDGRIELEQMIFERDLEED